MKIFQYFMINYHDELAIISVYIFVDAVIAVILHSVPFKADVVCSNELNRSSANHITKILIIFS